MSAQKQNMDAINYYIFYSKNNAMVKVTKKTFKKLALPVLDFTKFKVKIHGGMSRKIVKTLLQSFRAEGIIDSCSDVLSGVTVVWQCLSLLGRVNKQAQKYTSLIMPVCLLLLELKDLYQNPQNITGSTLIKISLHLINLYIGSNSFAAESLDSFALAGISYLLPSAAIDFLKRMQTFSNAKICDDSSAVYRVSSIIIDFISTIMAKLPFGMVISGYIQDLLKWCKISPSHFLLYRMENVLNKYEQARKQLLSKEFVKEIKDLYKEIDVNKEILEWSKRSAVVSTKLAEFKRMHTIVCYNESVSRVEPAAFIFEGPPGCGKSITSTQIQACLQEQIYTHITKPAGETKDFYDNYAEQPIFAMDDVGAGGPSQWRNLINMVSEAKLPLDCAQAHLKGTKFFNSEIILITSNDFSSLNGLTKTDCIANKEALHRRGFVFNFDNAKVTERSFTGKVVLKYFDAINSQWVEGLPQYLFRFCPSLKNIPAIYVSSNGDLKEFFGWTLAVIKGVRLAKKNMHDSLKLSDADVDNVKNIADRYLSEGIDKLIAIANIGNIFHPAVEEEDEESATFVDDVTPPSVFDRISSQVEKVIDLVSDSFIQAFVKSKIFYEVLMDFFRGFIDSMTQNISSIMDGGIKLWVVIIFVIFVCVILSVTLFKKKSVFIPEYSLYQDSAHVPRNLVRGIYDVTINSTDGQQSMKALISGHLVILPYHSLIHSVGGVKADNFRIVIYGDKDKGSILVDQELVSIVYSDSASDLVVLSLPENFPTPFKNLSKFVQEDVKIVNPYFLNNHGVIALSGYDFSAAQTNVYAAFDWQNSFGPTDFQYNVHGPGLCGSLIVVHTGERTSIVGMHVAGCKTQGKGVAKFWSPTIRSVLYNLMKKDVNFQIPFKPAPYKEDSSVMRLRLDEEQMSIDEFKKIQASVPTTSKLISTPLYGIYPVTRFPAQLDKFGRCTVKDVAKKSFSKVKQVDEAEMDFAVKCLNNLVPSYCAITESEVVKGTALLAGLNKDSSNGFGCLKDKNEYIDFEAGKFKDFLREEIIDIEKQLKEGKYPWKSFVWVEALKDELRGVEKEGEPRSFRVGTIHSQILAKKYMGNMVEKIIMDKWFSGIMVGINPFKDWQKLYEKLISTRVFAADIKKWDGGMLPQVQRAVINIIASKCETVQDRFIIRAILESLVHSLVILQDDLVMTTHSLPSGHFLTAIFNSLVNRFYTAMWYYRNIKTKGITPTVLSFFSDVLDFVYGDDKLVGVLRHEDVLNARTCRSFFESIGLGLTTSDKREIDFDFQSIDEVDFLKRKFVFHEDLGKIMCPLDLRTLYSGLSFADSSKVMGDVVGDKIHNFQRELYLHPNFDQNVSDFYDRLNRLNYPYLALPKSYLRFLYSDSIELDELFQRLYI